MTEPGRILHVFGGMDRGGAETMVMNLYRHIDRRALQFDFAVHTDRPCHYDSEIESLGGRIFRHPSPPDAGLLAWTSAFRQTLRSRGPFLAVHSHVHLFSGVVLLVSRCHGVPVRISHSHTAGADTGPSPWRRAYRQAMRLLIRGSATRLLGCSHDACEALFGAECWSDPRVRVTPNAISLAASGEPAASRQVLRRELQLPGDAVLIGHVGSFTEAKNHAFVVRAFHELRRCRPSARLVLVGAGPLRSGVEASVRASGLGGSVHFLGVRSDVPRILAALDILLLPSLWEGIPLVLIEAQAAGVPCVVSDRVSRECDLRAGLVRFASLRNSPAQWAQDCLDHLRRDVPSRAEREGLLRDAGYDAVDAARRLAAIYTDRELAWTS